MKIVTLIAILFSTAACSQMKSDYSVDPEIQPFLSSFLSEASTRGSHPQTTSFADSWSFSMRFGELKGNVIGLCRLSSGSVAKSPIEFGSSESREIIIDRDFWTRMVEIQKIEVIYHELAHCTLKRGHLNTLTDFTLDNRKYYYPSSFMNEYSISFSNDFQVLSFFKYYVDELFGVASLSSRVKVGDSMMASSIPAQSSTSPSRAPTSVSNVEGHEDCVFEESKDEYGNRIDVMTCSIKATDEQVKSLLNK